MSKRFTEGICGDGASILDNGRPLTIIEILKNLNKLDELEQLGLFNVVGRSEELCGDLHSTDWNGKCFKCGEQVFVKEKK